MNEKLSDWLKIVVQVAVIIWGAATLKAKVDDLNESVVALTKTVSAYGDKLQNLEVDRAVDEIRIGNLENSRVKQ